MPELVEVELCRRDLALWTQGRAVEAVDGPDAALWGSHTAPLEFLEWRRHGKQLAAATRCEGQGAAVLVHLGMTGRWQRGTSDRARLRWHLDDGTAVSFIDPRRFGGVHRVTSRDAERAFAALGPDAWDHVWSGAALQAVLTGRAPLQHALMEQGRIAGLGNIASSEIAWLAGVDGAAPVNTLDAAAWDRIAHAVRAHLEHVFRAEEGHEITYVSQGGPNPFRVYGREGQPCPRCGAAIDRRVLRGRSLYACGARCRP